MKKIIYFSLFVALMLFSCKKKEHNYSSQNMSGPDECLNFPSIGGQLEYSEDAIQFKFPAINPNNKNEIVYNFIDYGPWPWTLQLVKYNLQTKQKQVLVENVYLNSIPAWTDDGKIYFENINNQIFCVNSDGSGFLPFATAESNLAPSWSKIDDAIIWKQGNLQTGLSSILRKKIDQNDIEIISNQSGESPIVSQNNILLISSGGTFYTFDLKTADSFDNNDYVEVPGSISGVTLGKCWSAVNNCFYTNKAPIFNVSENFGLYQINYLTGQTTKIMDFCDSKHYTNISSSPDGIYLIGQRVDCYQKFNPDGSPTGEIVRNSSIYKIHIATGTETKINL